MSDYDTPLESSYDSFDETSIDESAPRRSRTSVRQTAVAPPPVQKAGPDLVAVFHSFAQALSTIMLIILLVVSAVLVGRLQKEGIKSFKSGNATNCRNANHYWQMAVGILVVSCFAFVWNLIQSIIACVKARQATQQAAPARGGIMGFIISGGLISLLVNTCFIVMGGILLEYAREDQWYNYRYQSNTYPATYQNQSPSNGINRFFFYFAPTNVNEASLDPFGNGNANNIDFTKCYQTKDWFLAQALGGLAVAFGGFLLLSLLCGATIAAAFATFYNSRY